MSARKAVVVEVGKGWAIVLEPDGEYKKVMTSAYLEVGDSYQLKSGTKFKYLTAAALFLTILLGSIDYYTVQAYAEVSSLVELGVNRWGRVISVQAKDKEGQIVLDTVKIRNDRLETAVEKVSQAIKEESPQMKGAIQTDSRSVKSKNKSNRNLEEKMLKEIDKGLERANKSNNIKNKVIKNNRNKAINQSLPQFRNPSNNEKMAESDATIIEEPEGQKQEKKPDHKQERLNQDDKLEKHKDNTGKESKKDAVPLNPIQSKKDADSKKK
ncbi:MAG: hypothetical protein PHE26_13350 [Syntrophomonadaceae bacterium]|nr:hypothetical protein [Syntrophomonadaceae bacterium]